MILPFTVRFRDRVQNLVDNDGAVVSYRDSTGAQSGSFPLTRSSLGTYRTQATRFNQRGVFQIWVDTAQYGALRVIGANRFHVQPLADSIVSFVGIEQRPSITAGDTLPSFIATVVDKLGNLTDNTSARFTYSRAGGSSTATVSATRLSTGTYLIASTIATLAGNYTLSVSGITSLNIEGKRTFVVRPAPMAHVDFVVTTSAMTTRGGSIFVTANVYDRFGNRTDNLNGYDSLAVIVTNKEILASTATIAFTRQSLGVYKAQVPILVPGPYQSELGGWKKDGMLTSEENVFVRIIDAVLRTTLDVSLSPGLAVRADFAHVPTRLMVSDTFSPLDNQAVGSGAKIHDRTIR